MYTFSIQSEPNYSPTQIIKIVKSITAKEVFARCPEVKKIMGRKFLDSGLLCVDSERTWE